LVVVSVRLTRIEQPRAANFSSRGFAMTENAYPRFSSRGFAMMENANLRYSAFSIR